MKKLFVLTLIVFLFSCSSSSSEEIRKPAVAGAFYPADKEELASMIDIFLDNAEKLDIDGKNFTIIVPHAGYVYSGQVASYGFKQLEGRRINSVVLICNSHTAYFSGIAIDGSDLWQTPLGLVKVDKDLADRLVKSNEAIRYNSSAHRDDHTLEVQLPFLQRVLKKDFKIVPILFGNTDIDTYKSLAQILDSNLGKDDIIVISTDMSHYPRYEDANKVDQGTLEMISQRNISQLEEYIKDIEAQDIPGEQTLLCGIDGVKTVMELYNISGKGEIKILNYANSGDVEIGDRSRVVGYGSVVIYIPDNPGEKGDVAMNEEYLNKEEKQKLMAIARASIIEAVTGKRQPDIEVTEPRLKEDCGAFVTIKKHTELRGCIGYIIAVKPLHETVKDVAKSAAISDFRFSPVSKEELDEIELEISALTPLKKIQSVEEIEVGKHGLYMKRGFNSGILLPQVPTEYGWDRETFLEHTCRKAGLPTNAWKDSSTEISIFSAEVFSEKDLQ